MDLQSKQRRQLLLDKMLANENQGISCKSCSGKCCTFVANSMQITELEGVEIAQYLNESTDYPLSLWLQRMEETIANFRLDQVVYGQGRKRLRKSYTCPFFNVDSKHPGCYIPPENKPYGCLGFNPLSSGLSDGQNCGQDKELLEKREDSWKIAESQLVTNSLIHSKETIPVVLKSLLTRQND